MKQAASQLCAVCADVGFPVAAFGLLYCCYVALAAEALPVGDLVVDGGLSGDTVVHCMDWF